MKSSDQPDAAESGNLSAKEVFLGALEYKDPREQQAFLDARCCGNELLRGEVEALLEAQQGLEAFLETPALDPGLRAADSARSNNQGTRVLEPSIQLGQQLGPYRLLQQIGVGGCGVVYMAEQQEPVRRRVALKVIKLGMDTEQVIARFEAERQALAILDHPNIET